MAAGVAKGAAVAQKVNVAQLHLLDAVDLGLVVILGSRVDALPSTVTGNDFLAVCGFIHRRFVCLGWRWSRSHGSPSAGLLDCCSSV